MGKRVVAINTILTGSTGNIMRNLCDEARINGFETWTATSFRKKALRVYPCGEHDLIIGNYLSLYLHVFLGRITGLKGCFSIAATWRFIKQLKRIKPDLIHLHNLHDSYINLPILFRYIKKNHIKVIWTLHDCWAFTGRCPYFTLSQCSRWMKGCSACPYPHRAYPKANVDMTRLMWKIKRSCFTGIEECTIVTPSSWLAELTGKSFLGEYQIQVINNGIDLNTFKPIESDFREKHGIADKKLVLGVAPGWEKRKGIDVMIALAGMLDRSYQVVLVGTNAEIDKNLPENVLSIHQTEDQAELAKIYTAADVFVNPTREDNFPTVNIESLACGTPVVAFDTGGSPEILDEDCGAVVAVDDMASLYREVVRISNEKRRMRDHCIQRSKKFDKRNMFQNYIARYEQGS
jgi:glycosyltransferase involved in cell wall biosynthesis